MLTSIVGINWGDEGKGRMVDLLSKDYDIVCRYQGGNNAGHTVINERGKFILNLLPSGILREGVVCVMGPGMVIDIKHLAGEMARLREAGISITPDNLKISDRAVITMPYHVQQDCLEEARLADKKFGSTKRGIAFVYADKYMKKAFRMGELLNLCKARARHRGVEKPHHCQRLRRRAGQSGGYRRVFQGIRRAPAGLHLRRRSVPERGEQGGQKDHARGAAGRIARPRLRYLSVHEFFQQHRGYGPIGAGVPNLKLDKTIGIMKAYSTCVGEGPFTAEYFGEKAEKLRKAGGEYGAATGRPRRVGPFDVVASKYGIRCQGADEIALTKLDVLSGHEELEVCVAYELDGKKLTEFPFTDVLDDCKPVFEKIKGWNCDISKCRKKEDLPKEALDYIRYIEKACECKVRYVSVGAERDAYIEM